MSRKFLIPLVAAVFLAAPAFAPAPFSGLSDSVVAATTDKGSKSIKHRYRPAPKPSLDDRQGSSQSKEIAPPKRGLSLGRKRPMKEHGNNRPFRQLCGGGIVTPHAESSMPLRLSVRADAVRRGECGAVRITSDCDGIWRSAEASLHHYVPDDPLPPDIVPHVITGPQAHCAWGFRLWAPPAGGGLPCQLHQFEHRAAEQAVGRRQGLLDLEVVVALPDQELVRLAGSLQRGGEVA